MRTPPADTARTARPSVLRWIWYAFGGRLPQRLSPWVLADTTRRTWVWRHLARAAVQIAPVALLCGLVVPLPLDYRLTLAIGGFVLALGFSMAFMTETIEHRVTKAGYPPGTAARLRAERQDRDRSARHARYRRDGAGSFD